MLPRLIPVTDVKRKATEIIEALQREQEPLLITEHGREAAILMDVTSYRMRERKLELLEGIIRGQKAMAEGRTLTQEEVMARTAKWS
jgi:prevent-host-death family protein